MILLYGTGDYVQYLIIMCNETIWNTLCVCVYIYRERDRERERASEHWSLFCTAETNKILWTSCTKNLKNTQGQMYKLICVSDIGEMCILLWCDLSITE